MKEYKHFIYLVCLLVIFVSSCQAEKGSKKKEEAPVKPNHLINEKSPYLLQHAYNPVNWYPWGEEAFEKAQQEDKPIFLSIGYSTCHWCHVMEEESFTNHEIAALINEHFVAIKVDREERPDIDAIYMNAVQLMTGSGGWPLSIFLTPEGSPFYGGTYFPPQDQWGRPGFKKLLLILADMWRTKRVELMRSADNITKAFEQKKGKGEKLQYDEALLQKTFNLYRLQFDKQQGGFQGAPKFPMPHILSFLMRYWYRTGNAEGLVMVEKTLAQMARGGIHDHLGGGFHRYSVDRQWRVPHFEKMLYDQALIAKAYLEAYQITKQELYATTARDILDFILREMTDENGGFYSALDADSAPDPAYPDSKQEGAYYVWSLAEIVNVLGEEKGKIFSYVYGVEQGGNALSDPHGEFENNNILYEDKSLEETAKKFNKPLAEVRDLIDTAKKKLLLMRSERLRPHVDDKILTDWNGLAISTFAYAGRVLGIDAYTDAARAASDFILEHMRRKDGRLLHRYRAEEAIILGFLSDYAFFIHGLFDLYEATFDERYLGEARRLTTDMIELFWDNEEGAFFFTGQDAEKLIHRSKEIYDGAIPSGNSVAALNLLRLGRLTATSEFESYAEKLFNVFSHQIQSFPGMHAQLLIAFDFALGPTQEITIAAGKQRDQEFVRIKKVLNSNFLPRSVMILKESDSTLHASIPFLKDQVPLAEKTTVYMCENYVCKKPITTAKELDSFLEETFPQKRNMRK